MGGVTKRHAVQPPSATARTPIAVSSLKVVEPTTPVWAPTPIAISPPSFAVAAAIATVDTPSALALKPRAVESPPAAIARLADRHVVAVRRRRLAADGDGVDAQRLRAGLPIAADGGGVGA